MVARDLMQNFFDVNKERINEIRVELEAANVTIFAPDSYDLERLYYLGSEKGSEEIC